jgi:hypothetical protein
VEAAFTIHPSAKDILLDGIFRTLHQLAILVHQARSRMSMDQPSVKHVRRGFIHLLLAQVIARVVHLDHSAPRDPCHIAMFALLENMLIWSLQVCAGIALSKLGTICPIRLLALSVQGFPE